MRLRLACCLFAVVFFCLGALPQHARPLVILDAGHGGSDEGAKVHYFQEKRITLATTLLVKKHLTEAGYRVILTRSRDVFLPLHRRVSIANKTRAVLFVSVHYNASHNREAKGIEVFYHGGDDLQRAHASKHLAHSVLSHLSTYTQAEMRGVKMANFHVIRETKMPAILVEGGFITNPEERLLLRDKAYLDRIARGIATGVDKYLRNP
jgi:N-acetylmuramoyl-L-alanine amidase